jgi:hypothetical protein
MSRDFELLERTEKEFVSPAANNGGQASRIPANELLAPELGAAVGNDDLIRLIRSVFLPTTGKAYHQVVFCGIEKANGSSSVCLHSGQTLAANTAERVCLVDAARGSSGLSGLFEVPGHCDDADGKEQSVQLARNLWLVSSPATTQAGILPSPWCSAFRCHCYGPQRQTHPGTRPFAFCMCQRPWWERSSPDRGARRWR